MMIDAIKNGSTAAFEDAYNIYNKKVFSYFLKKTNSIEDTKDLVQITFCKLWQYRKSLSADFLPEQQLFHIARTVFIDYLRRENKIQKVRVTAKSNMETIKHADEVYEFDVHERLQKTLSGLPSIRKKVFELHKIEGYSYKEIAEILSIPVKSVDNNLAKALKYLRSIDLIFIITFIHFLH